MSEQRHSPVFQLKFAKAFQTGVAAAPNFSLLSLSPKFEKVHCFLEVIYHKNKPLILRLKGALNIQNYVV